MYCKNFELKQILLNRNYFKKSYKKLKAIGFFSLILLHLIKLYNSQCCKKNLFFLKKNQIKNFAFNFQKKSYIICQLSRLYSKHFLDYFFENYSLNLIFPNIYIKISNFISNNILHKNNGYIKYAPKFCFLKKKLKKIFNILIFRKYLFLYETRKFFIVNLNQFISKLIFCGSKVFLKYPNIEKYLCIENLDIYRSKQFKTNYYNILSIIKQIVKFFFYLDVFLQNMFKFLDTRNNFAIYNTEKKGRFIKSNGKKFRRYLVFLKIENFNQLNFLLINHSNSLILWIRKITSKNIRPNIARIKNIFNNLPGINISAKKNSVIKIFLLTLELIKGNPNVNILIFKYFLTGNKDFFSDLTQKFYNRMPFILEKNSSKSINKIKYTRRLFVLPFEIFYTDLFRKFFLVKIFYSNVNFQKLYLSNWIYMEFKSFNYKIIKNLLKMKYIKKFKLISISKLILKNFISLYLWNDAFDFLKNIHRLNLSK